MSFLGLDKITIDETDRLWGEDLAMFLQGVENWRGTLIQSEPETFESVIKLVTRVHFACMAHIQSRGDFEHASMSLEDIRTINVLRLANHDHNYAMRYIENIFRGALVLKQGRFGDYLKTCDAHPMREKADAAGTLQSGFNFLHGAHEFANRVHATKLDDFARGQIDAHRADYYFCCIAKHPSLSGPALGEAFWKDLKTISESMNAPFEAATKYTPKFFTRYGPAKQAVSRFTIN